MVFLLNIQGRNDTNVTQTFSKTKQGAFPSLCLEVSMTLILKPDKDIIKKIPHMDAKTLNKTLANRI